MVLERKHLLYVKCALVLTSAIFFWRVIYSALSGLFHFNNMLLGGVVIISTGIVSFTGTLIFLLYNDFKPLYRAPMLPVSVVTLIIAVCGFLIISPARQTYGDLFGAIESVGILLLVPLSLFVFHSLRTDERVRKVSFYLTTVFSFIAVLGLFTLPLFFAYHYGIFMSRVAIIMDLFITFGLPLVGICYIACGIFARE